MFVVRLCAVSCARIEKRRRRVCVECSVFKYVGAKPGRGDIVADKVIRKCQKENVPL